MTAFSAYLSEKNDGADVDFDDEVFRIAGSNETPSMLEVAAMARDDGREELLKFDERIESGRRRRALSAWPSATTADSVDAADRIR